MSPSSECTKMVGGSFKRSSEANVESAAVRFENAELPVYRISFSSCIKMLVELKPVKLYQR